MKTLSDEAKQLRLEVIRMRPGRGRKYSPPLRRRILAWVERAKRTGMLDADCSHALGVPQHRFEMWREYERRDARAALSAVPAETPQEQTVSLVPIDLTAPERPSEPASIRLGLGLTFISPHGFRIEGLTYEQAFALLKEFE